jgi:hypothetical protein
MKRGVWLGNRGWDRGGGIELGGGLRVAVRLAGRFGGKSSVWARGFVLPLH